MMYGLYTLALGAAVTGYVPVALARRVTTGVPLNLRERLGLGTHAPPATPVGWVHAVSVGEAIAAAPLLEGLRRAYPALPAGRLDRDGDGRPRGARAVRGPGHASYFPLDFPPISRRVIGSISPAFFVCMETELWPNTLRALAARGVPAMIANGRLSDRSFRRYRIVRSAMRRVLADVTVFGMQSAEDARRVIALGAPPERVVVTGNLKAEPLADPRARAICGIACSGSPTTSRCGSPAARIAARRRRCWTRTAARCSIVRAWPWCWRRAIRSAWAR
jgi:3-deoxy-D-manno-octulosonic-acid transferase